MLFGEATDFPTACQLMDACMDAGVNFFDSAEMYPVPQREETSGRSEEYLGRWMKAHPRYSCGVLLLLLLAAAVIRPRRGRTQDHPADGVRVVVVGTRSSSPPRSPGRPVRCPGSGAGRRP